MHFNRLPINFYRFRKNIGRIPMKSIEDSYLFYRIPIKFHRVPNSFNKAPTNVINSYQF